MSCFDPKCAFSAVNTGGQGFDEGFKFDPIAYVVSIRVEQAVSSAVISSICIRAVAIVVGGCGIVVASRRSGATGYFERVADTVVVRVV